VKSDRLLSTLLLLQAHGRLSGRDLARRLEVSQRTIHRDMDALSAAGVPVYALRGAQGGWQLDEDWRTQVPGLDEAELRGLLMAQPRVIGDPRLAAAAESAIGKLMAALPVALRARAAAIRQRLHVDTTGWRGGAEDLAMLPIVQDAVWSDRKLAFRYRQPSGERVQRTVDPLGLVAKGSTWYLFAGTPRGFRTYRVSRMERARVLDEAAERPARFDLAEAWKSAAAEFQGRPRYQATLRLDPAAVEWVKEWRVASPVDGQENVYRIEFAEEAEACFVVLGLASHVEVIEPASLRERAAKERAGCGGLRSPAHP
jgi:predicted DNA-binding transcriptional regulator YafY